MNLRCYYQPADQDLMIWKIIQFERGNKYDETSQTFNNDNMNLMLKTAQIRIKYSEPKSVLQI